MSKKFICIILLAIGYLDSEGQVPEFELKNKSISQVLDAYLEAFDTENHLALMIHFYLPEESSIDGYEILEDLEHFKLIDSIDVNKWLYSINIWTYSTNLKENKPIAYCNYKENMVLIQSSLTDIFEEKQESKSLSKLKKHLTKNYYAGLLDRPTWIVKRVEEQKVKILQLDKKLYR